jgi:AraC-like DNA-binding protein
MPTTAFGALLARRFRVENPPTIVAMAPLERAMTFTRLRTDASDFAFADVPPEDAYSIHVTASMTAFTLRNSRRGDVLHRLPAGSLSFHDFNAPPRVVMHTPLDTLRFHVPRRSLERFAEEIDGKGEIHLNAPPQGTDDATLRLLAVALAAVIDRPEIASTLAIDQIALAVQAHLVRCYGTRRVADRTVGGLAPWQERRATEAMAATLADDVSISRLAEICGLSASHFARAFKASTGRPPHRWLLERRVDAAREQLLRSTRPLQEIAVACGFADQSHLTRVFARMVGASPAAWRRAHRGGIAVSP